MTDIELLEQRRKVVEVFLERGGVPKLGLPGTALVEAERAEGGANFFDEGECVCGRPIERERVEATKGRKRLHDAYVVWVSWQQTVECEEDPLEMEACDENADEERGILGTFIRLARMFPAV